MPAPQENPPETPDHLDPEQPAAELNRTVAQMGVELAQALADAVAEADQYRSEVQYKEAELQTARRRAAEERSSAVNAAKAGMVRALLPALESLALAAAHIPDNDPVGQGVKLVSRQFADALKSEGVTTIAADPGAVFDPMEHEAQASMETADYPPGCIAAVIRPGYRLPDRVIQPAQVIVAREPQSPAPGRP